MQDEGVTPSRRPCHKIGSPLVLSLTKGGSQMPGLMENSMPISSMPYASNGARLVSPTGEELSLRRVAITSETGGGIARTVLRQHFEHR